MWRLSYVEKLKSKGFNPIYFEKGNYVHEILHYYYSLVRAGYVVGSDIALKAVTDRIKEDIVAEMERAEKEGREADIGFYRDVAKAIQPYVQNISPKIDSKITFVEHEYHIEVEPEGSQIQLHGYIDLIYYDLIRKAWVIRDHKTGAKNVWSNKKVEEDIQLLFYATLWYILTGEVPIVEINYLNTSQASKPQKSTVLFDLFTAYHNESTLKAFWNYLQSVLDRMENSQALQNLSACSGCAYRQICRAGLRGYSADQIKKANFNGPHSKPVEEVSAENPDGSVEDSKPFHITLGR